MIEAICTTCRASKTSDVKTRLKLLQRLNRQIPIGLEVVGPVSDFMNPDARRIIIENVAMARDCGINQVIVHSPVERLEYKSTDLSEDKTVKILQTVFELAEKLKAKIVVTHCEICQPFTKIRELNDKKRNRLKELIAENLQKINKGSALLAIENMADFTMGDVFFCSSDMPAFPFFVDLLELYEFAKENSFFITFDTCHWAALCIPIPLVSVYQKIEDRICHIHLSDAWGRWINGLSRCEEGIVLGDGNLGKNNFAQLIAYLQEKKSKPVTLTVEVRDKDLGNPKESGESLNRVLSWLSS